MKTINEIHPADRLATVQEYYLQRKMKEVAALNAAGADIVSLGIGGPDMMPPQQAIDTLCSAIRQPGNHSYQLGIANIMVSVSTRRLRFCHCLAQRKA